MKLFKSAGDSLLGFHSDSNDDWTINKLTLKFTGNMEQYEEEFLEDYYQRTLKPFRFSLVLALVFYGAFALLDAVTVPTLKEVFWLHLGSD